MVQIEVTTDASHQHIAAKPSVYRRSVEVNEQNLELDSATCSTAIPNPPCGSVSSCFSKHVDEETREVPKLLPGIPDDVVVEHICTKMSWLMLMSLSQVNRAWWSMIVNRQVYEARLRTKSTQPFLISVHRALNVAFPANTVEAVGYTTSVLPELTNNSLITTPPIPKEFQFAFSLYDIAANSWHTLPPLPGVLLKVPHMSRCCVVNGTLYVIGGDDWMVMHNPQTKKPFYVSEPTKKVYKLDLAANRRTWQECSRMWSARSDFACGILDGEIYVAGGWSPCDHVQVAGEVYCPELDWWRPIADMEHAQMDYTVAIFQNKLHVIGGTAFKEALEDRLNQEDGVDCTEVYNAEENCWKQAHYLTRGHNSHTYFVADGRLHSLDYESIQVYKEDTNSWEELQPNLWSEFESSFVCQPRYPYTGDALAFCGEVFVFVHWPIDGTLSFLRSYGVSLLRSKGFGLKNATLRWEPIPCPFEFNQDFTLLCPIEL